MKVSTLITRFQLMISLLWLPVLLCAQYQPALNKISRPERLGLLLAYYHQTPDTLGKTLNIIHFGDSHVQSGFFGETVKQRLQHAYGNAGPGFIFPHSLAKTNGNRDFTFLSPAEWQVGRNTDLQLANPVGLGGWSLIQNNRPFSISVTVKDTTYYRNMFNAIRVFAQGDGGYQLALSYGDTLMPPVQKDVYSTRWALPEPTNTLLLKGEKKHGGEERFVLHGVSLENGNPGVLYHVIGVNGSRFGRFAQTPLFAEQARELHPDLFIVSMGTNEAQNNRFSDVTFKTEMDVLVQQLLRSNPNAIILFTTPMASYKTTYRYRTVNGKRRRTRISTPNPVVQQVRNSIISYAEEHNHSVWDLYALAGGEQAAAQWKKQGLMAADGVHFTREGYELQGKLLYEALMATRERVFLSAE